LEKEESLRTKWVRVGNVGLGKTLQVAMLHSYRPPSKPCYCGTLVIGPVSLVTQWQKELQKYFLDPVKICLYHGPKRFGMDLSTFNFVLTSYNTLQSDFKNGNLEIFSVEWYRIVLDEAHEIRNESALKSKACYQLNGKYKWCITGTPIQNELKDLYSLLKFLQVCDYENFGK
jgi:SNF2 family DNA or RNA helicase